MPLPASASGWLTFHTKEQLMLVIGAMLVALQGLPSVCTACRDSNPLKKSGTLPALLMTKALVQVKVKPEARQGKAGRKAK
jgi:hypothetical protein